MGTLCCNMSEEMNYILSNFAELKSKLKDEYKSYLSFLYKLKRDLNSSIIDRNAGQNNNNNNKINNLSFYLIPRIWFGNWEKRIVTICKTNKYKSYSFKYEYKNEENIPLFYYELVSDEIWLQFCRNKVYKLNSNNRKIKTSIICNNLIILYYNKTNIEVFFFEKEEDLFFTNLLFSFEKCQDSQKECSVFLELLKKSPIQEILGNMHYDSSKEFLVTKNNVMIYNKTEEVEEEVKKFREKQYDLEFISPIHGPSLIDSEKDQQQIEDNFKINGYFEIHKGNKMYYEGLIKLRQKKESNTMGYDMSGSCLNIHSSNIRSSLINNANNSRSIKIMKNNTLNDIDKNKTYYFALRNNALVCNKIIDKDKTNVRNIILNQNPEISTIFDYKSKYTNIFDCFEEKKNNKSFFESIIYCLFNIKELTDYFLNNKPKKIDENNSFCDEYLKIIQFLSQKKKNLFIKLNINKNDNTYNLSNNNGQEENYNENYLINSCPEYNFQKIIRLINYQNSLNIICKILYTFHLELNQSTNNLIENEFLDKILNQNESEKQNVYQNFLKESKENNDSIIYDLFYGIREAKVICNKCKNSYYKFEIMNTIDFSIHKLAKYAKEMNNKNNIINIMDCINYYNSEKKQNEKILIECKFCNEYQNYTLQNIIYKYPEVFIICFYYDNYYLDEEDEYDIKIDFDEKIKLLNDEYNLFGIISLEKNIKSEDDTYIAYCKNDNKWVFYGDEVINNFDFENDKKNIVPIVLFYKKVK